MKTKPIPFRISPLRLVETMRKIHPGCKAISITDDRLSASFVDIDSDLFDILEALMLRRKKLLEKLKTRISYNSMADGYPDLGVVDVQKINESFKKLEVSVGDRKRELMEVHQEALNLKEQGLSLGYDLMRAICNELCLFIGRLDKAGPKEVDVIKLHVEAINWVIANDIKGTGGDAGEKMLAGLQQVCDKLHT